MTDKLVNVNSRSSLTEFAGELKMFIVKQKLFSEIKGKNYVNVEGWEFAGMATGISPIVKSVIREYLEGEIKYRAEVELVDANDKVVGWGMAICSNKEQSKKSFDEYAIASMAQTRAIGKAFRNKFAFLMKMAGYEPTPAEEVETNGSVKAEIKIDPANDKKPATEEQLATIRSMIEKKQNLLTTAVDINYEPENITFNRAVEIINTLVGLK